MPGKTSGRDIDAAILRHISPEGFEHINCNGVIVFFLFERYHKHFGRRAAEIRSHGPFISIRPTPES